MSIAANWTRENIAWAAGIFEGEGSIGITGKPPQGRRVVLQVSMTDEDVIKKLHFIMGVGHVGGPYHPSTRPKHHKAHWRWTVTGGRQSQAVLAAFWPYLCSRRTTKAEEAIRFFASQQVWTKNRLVCPRGHLYTADNIYHHKRGGRACKACAAERYIEQKQNVHHDLLRTSVGS